MAHGDTQEWKWRGKWWLEWVASTLHTASERGVSIITTADEHTSAVSKLNWRPHWLKWTRPLRWKTKSGFYMCAITFQMQSTYYWCELQRLKDNSMLKICTQFHMLFHLFLSLFSFVSLYVWLRNNKSCLTLNLLTWRIRWAPNTASRWQMGFNLAFKFLMYVVPS